MSGPALELAAVRFGYGDGAVIDGLDLRLGPGLTLLVGPNGCGKSTLLKLMAGVEPPDSGRVLVCGHDLWKDEVTARRALAYVPEHPDLSPDASQIEVARQVCSLRGEPLERASAVLAEAGLSARAHASVRELSAGQRRRALLAAAWVGTPRVALLDEPLESLDRALRERVVRWIGELAEGGAAVVVVSHELEPFAALAQAAITVRDGRALGPVPLSAEASRRLAVLEALARGEE
ncbi:MAG: ATP-binding cassette domain-containing protein [Betaproteobacteria bacterium]